MRHVFLSAPARGRSAAQAGPLGPWSDERRTEAACAAGVSFPPEERKKGQQGNAQQGKTLLGG